MRPYAFHKDQDGQYVETGISQANVIQPSPLVLLAATCSKIGQTVPESARSYSQGKSSALAETRSCSDQFKSSPFVCLDRSSDSFKACPPVAPANVQSPYFKVKQEESADYNQNFEDAGVCANAFHESRLRDKQRARATSGCGHKTRGYTANCEHVVENHEFFASNAQPDCEQSLRTVRVQPHEQQTFNSSSLVDQFGMPDHGFFVQNMSFSHSTSCVYENQAFQGSSLANLPAVTAAGSMSNFEPSPCAFNSQSDRQPDISSSWSNSLRDIRETEVSLASKPSCMMYERSPHLHHMPAPSQISTSTRHNLSHANAPVQLPLAPPTPSVPHQQFFSQQCLSPLQDARTCQNLRGPSSQPSQHVRPLPGYASGPADVKLNSYLQHPPQHFRSAALLNSSGEYLDSMYQSHVQHDLQQKWRYPAQFHLASSIHHHPSPTGQVGDVMAAEGVSLRMHADTMQIGDYASSTCSSPPPPIEVHSPPVLPGGPGMLHHAEAQGQAFSEYQYQQQQMYYARDNRRPRRIACTCPNCRDGDNKGIATKDGKQRKLHVCHVPGCGKIYGKTSHLRAHLRWHAGERPFACNWLFCNKRFTRSDELQRHRRTHTGDKRFQCRTCLKKFMRSDHLSKHMKTHLMQQKTLKTKNDSDSSSDGVSASTDSSESGDLGTQLKEILSDSPLPTTSS